MNKGQGVTLGLVLAAAYLFRPAGPSPGAPTDAGASETAQAQTSAIAPAEPRDGPWIASCNYWAAARAANPGGTRSPDISGDIGPQAVRLRVDLGENNRQHELGCEGQESDWWGIPESGKVQATAMIAVVPNPAHTHLALTFDRAVDAILQAAADNGYVSSYYWLPWKNRRFMKLGDAQIDFEPGHDAERERQPGLVILKYAQAAREAEKDSSPGYYQVIYLFLVAETPTEGVDGFQLKNALQYEADLSSRRHFATGQEGRLAVIGPTLSGSAASLRAGIESANQDLKKKEFEVAGATMSLVAANELTNDGKSAAPAIRYYSFAPSTDYATEQFVTSLRQSGYETSRVASLVEDNSVYANSIVEGENSHEADKSKKPERIADAIWKIRFPREISLLRNAESALEQPAAAAGSGTALSPYLHFSVRDLSAQDSIPIFSRENTPLSQEAQLMTIARQLRRYRIQFALISSSNILDSIFLAQFLHRACPETTLVFLNADLLTVREIDSVPFIGSISITSYPLIGMGRSTSRRNNQTRTYPNSSSYAYYNAASYTFWRNAYHTPGGIPLAGYGNLVRAQPEGYTQAPPLWPPPLWATMIGSDGYYPIGILSACSAEGDSALMLPTIAQNGEPMPHWQGTPGAEACKPNAVNIHAATPEYPSRVWYVLSAAIVLLCLFHCGILLAADYGSPMTRDLAIADNDHPVRRSLYIRAASAMLAAMAFVVAFPALWLASKANVDRFAVGSGAAVLACGLAAGVTALAKTRVYVRWQGPPLLSPKRARGLRRWYEAAQENFYFFLNGAVWAALAVILGLWAYACCTGSFAGHSPDFAGLALCYRSIHPGTGVSPVVPVLLLLFSWYSWGLLQTRRLRFSDHARPRLPGRLDDTALNRFYVSDEDLSANHTRRDCCLYANITCLMITRQLLARLGSSSDVTYQSAPGRPRVFGSLVRDICLALLYLALLLGFTIFMRVRAVDHFLSNRWQFLPSPYELLVNALFCPLLAISLAGWLRMILIWSALRRGLLERLENLPIRFAFSRLNGMGWMTMLRQGGLLEQRRDMARSLESMRQLLNQPGLRNLERADLSEAYDQLLEDLRLVKTRPPGRVEQPRIRKPEYEVMSSVEARFAGFGHHLLGTILIPYWKHQRTGLVESRQGEAPESAQPDRILMAEEFLAIRYISLIRAVLANLRDLMTFVSISFVLAIMAWNTYPFQPRQLLDWFFTALLAILGSGVIVVFAQMHRNAILSRITDTKMNELGWDFYWRVLSFGALPVFTWVASQFPDIGNLLYRFIEPAVPIIK